MKQRIAIAAGLLAIAVALVLWRRHGSPSTPPITPDRGAVTNAPIVTRGTPRPDPAKLARASLAGMVTDQDHQPIVGATVCAYGASATLAGEWLANPFCATSGADGAYMIDKLLPGTFTVGATARAFLPGAHHPGGDHRATLVPLVAGEAKTNLDILLEHGGVELKGTVSDIAGGPIAKARVWTDLVSFKAATEADGSGAFSLWVAPGNLEVFASADGYADGIAEAYAPGTTEILLTPDSSITGTVVDGATGEPIDGAHVKTAYVDASSVLSDAHGAFRISHLEPGRYRIEATTENGSGISEGTVAAVLGGTTGGVIVKLYPSARITGRVVIAETKQPCAAALAYLDDPVQHSARQFAADVDGTLSISGVRPGSYTPRVSCAGYVARDTYAPIVVGKDAVDVVWDVSTGGGIKGVVRTASGAPIPHITVEGWQEGATAEHAHFDVDDSALDGSYALRGLPAGTYSVYVRGAEPSALHVVVRGTEVVTQDLVASPPGPEKPSSHDPTGSGTIRGRVTDADGHPVSDAFITYTRAIGDRIPWSRFTPDTRPVLSGVDGTFALTGLVDGAYVVFAERRGGGEAMADHVSAGTQNLALVIKRTGAIHGVASPAATELAGRLLGSTGLRRIEKFEHSDGRFSFSDLPAGHYRIELTAPAAYARIEIDLADGEDKRGVTVEMQPLRTLHGRLLDAKTKAPIAGMVIAASSSASMSIDFTAIPPSQTTNASGVFTIEGAPPGEVTLAGFPAEGSPYGELNVTRTPTADGDLGDIALDPK